MLAMKADSLPVTPRRSIRVRRIADADIKHLVALFANGFRRRSPSFWQSALETLRNHPSPPDFPQYGYILENSGAIVGALLTISSKMPAGEEWATRCNLSSWYVEPGLRSYAPLLVNQAVKNRSATYLNVSAAPHTRAIVEAQGFTCYSTGQFLAFAPLHLRRTTGVEVVGAGVNPQADYDPFERDLLEAHASFGCISVWCIEGERAHPFVFRPLLAKRVLPCARLVYCRGIEEFVEFAPALCRFLLSRGRPLICIDANGPIPGLQGTYVDGLAPKYCRGPARIRPGDLAFTETAMFGF